MSEEYDWTEVSLGFTATISDKVAQLLARDPNIKIRPVPSPSHKLTDSTKTEA